MDKTNKITITCEDWAARMEISQAVADLLGANMLDVDDFIIRGSLFNGDIDEFSKEEFIQKYGNGAFLALENISYLAYVDTVEEPFVISLSSDRDEGIAETLRKTISINISETGRELYSTLSDYTIRKKETTSSTAEDIVDIITADERWQFYKNM